MGRHQQFLKFVAIVVIMCLLAQDVALAAQTANRTAYNVQSTEKGDLPSTIYDVPESLGAIDESFEGSNGKHVTFILDAHDSLNAQKNIVRLIQQATKERGVQTVFEEGYEGELNTDHWFGGIQDQQIKRKVSYYYLDQLKIGAAEFAHINRKAVSDQRSEVSKNIKQKALNAERLTPNADWVLIGADDKRAYLENVRAFGDSEKVHDQILRDTQAITRELKNLGGKTFSSEAQKWIAERERFQNQTLPLPDYLHRWMEKLPAGECSLLRRLLQAEKDPELVRSIQKVRATEILNELEIFETELEHHYFFDVKTREIWQALKAMQEVEKLAELKISRHELERLKNSLNDIRTEKLAPMLARAKKNPVVLSKRWETLIQTAMKFYELAHQRDEAVERALIAWRDQGKAYKVQRTTKDDLRSTMYDQNSNAVLVFGGFHREGITEILRRNGFSYTVVIPKIADFSRRHQEIYRQLMTSGVPRATGHGPRNVIQAARPLSNFYDAAFQFEIERAAQLAAKNPTLDQRSFALLAQRTFSTTAARGITAENEPGRPLASSPNTRRFLMGSVPGEEHRGLTPMISQRSESRSLTAKEFKRIFGEHFNEVIVFVTGNKLGLAGGPSNIYEEIDYAFYRDVRRYTFKLGLKTYSFFTKTGEPKEYAEIMTEHEAASLAEKWDVGPKTLLLKLEQSPMLISMPIQGKSITTSRWNLKKVKALGYALGRLHAAGIYHFDLVDSDSLKRNRGIADRHIYWDQESEKVRFIDFGYSKKNSAREALDFERARVQTAMERKLKKNYASTKVAQNFQQGYEEGRNSSKPEELLPQEKLSIRSIFHEDHLSWACGWTALFGLVHMTLFWVRRESIGLQTYWAPLNWLPDFTFPLMLSAMGTVWILLFENIFNVREKILQISVQSVLIFSSAAILMVEIFGPYFLRKGDAGAEFQWADVAAIGVAAITAQFLHSTKLPQTKRSEMRNESKLQKSPLLSQGWVHGANGTSSLWAWPQKSRLSEIVRSAPEGNERMFFENINAGVLFLIERNYQGKDFSEGSVVRVIRELEAQSEEWSDEERALMLALVFEAVPATQSRFFYRQKKEIDHDLAVLHDYLLSRSEAREEEVRKNLLLGTKFLKIWTRFRSGPFTADDAFLEFKGQMTEEATREAMQRLRDLGLLVVKDKYRLSRSYKILKTKTLRAHPANQFISMSAEKAAQIAWILETYDTPAMHELMGKQMDRTLEGSFTIQVPELVDFAEIWEKTAVEVYGKTRARAPLYALIFFRLLHQVYGKQIQSRLPLSNTAIFRKVIKPSQYFGSALAVLEQAGLIEMQKVPAKAGEKWFKTKPFGSADLTLADQALVAFSKDNDLEKLKAAVGQITQARRSEMREPEKVSIRSVLHPQHSSWTSAWAVIFTLLHSFLLIRRDLTMSESDYWQALNWLPDFTFTMVATNIAIYLGSKSKSPAMQNDRIFYRNTLHDTLWSIPLILAAAEITMPLFRKAGQTGHVFDWADLAAIGGAYLTLKVLHSTKLPQANRSEMRESSNLKDGLEALDELVAMRKAEDPILVALVGGGGMGTSTIGAMLGERGVGGFAPNEVEVLEGDHFYVKSIANRRLAVTEAIMKDLERKTKNLGFKDVLEYDVFYDAVARAKKSGKKVIVVTGGHSYWLVKSASVSEKAKVIIKIESSDDRRAARLSRRGGFDPLLPLFYMNEALSQIDEDPDYQPELMIVNDHRYTEEEMSALAKARFKSKNISSQTKKQIVFLISNKEIFNEVKHWLLLMKAYWGLHGHSMKVVRDATSIDLQVAIADRDVKQIAVVGHGTWNTWEASDTEVTQAMLDEWAGKKWFDGEKKLFITYTCGVDEDRNGVYIPAEKLGWNLVQNPYRDVRGMAGLTQASFFFDSWKLFSVEDLIDQKKWMVRFFHSPWAGMTYGALILLLDLVVWTTIMAWSTVLAAWWIELSFDPPVKLLVLSGITAFVLRMVLGIRPPVFWKSRVAQKKEDQITPQRSEARKPEKGKSYNVPRLANYVLRGTMSRKDRSEARNIEDLIKDSKATDEQLKEMFVNDFPGQKIIMLTRSASKFVAHVLTTPFWIKGTAIFGLFWFFGIAPFPLLLFFLMTPPMTVLHEMSHYVAIRMLKVPFLFFVIFDSGYAVVRPANDVKRHAVILAALAGPMSDVVFTFLFYHFFKSHDSVPTTALLLGLLRLPDWAGDYQQTAKEFKDAFEEKRKTPNLTWRDVFFRADTKSHRSEARILDYEKISDMELTDSVRQAWFAKYKLGLVEHAIELADQKGATRDIRNDVAGAKAYGFSLKGEPGGIFVVFPFAEIENERDNGYMAFFNQAGEMVSEGLYSAAVLPTSQKKMLMLRFQILPEHRSQGYGRMMVEALREFTATLDPQMSVYFRLEEDELSKPALRQSLKQLGFEDYAVSQLMVLPPASSRSEARGFFTKAWDLVSKREVRLKVAQEWLEKGLRDLEIRGELSSDEAQLLFASARENPDVLVLLEVLGVHLILKVTPHPGAFGTTAAMTGLLTGQWWLVPLYFLTGIFRGIATFVLMRKTNLSNKWFLILGSVIPVAGNFSVPAYMLRQPEMRQIGIAMMAVAKMRTKEKIAAYSFKSNRSEARDFEKEITGFFLRTFTSPIKKQAFIDYHRFAREIAYQERGADRAQAAWATAEYDFMIYVVHRQLAQNLKSYSPDQSFRFIQAMDLENLGWQIQAEIESGAYQDIFDLLDWRETPQDFYKEMSPYLEIIRQEAEELMRIDSSRTGAFSYSIRETSDDYQDYFRFLTQKIGKEELVAFDLALEEFENQQKRSEARKNIFDGSFYQEGELTPGVAQIWRRLFPRPILEQGARKNEQIFGADETPVYFKRKELSENTDAGQITIYPRKHQLNAELGDSYIALQHIDQNSLFVGHGFFPNPQDWLPGHVRGEGMSFSYWLENNLIPVARELGYERIWIQQSSEKSAPLLTKNGFKELGFHGLWKRDIAVRSEARGKRKNPNVDQAEKVFEAEIVLLKWQYRKYKKRTNALLGSDAAGQRPRRGSLRWDLFQEIMEQYSLIYWAVFIVQIMQMTPEQKTIADSWNDRINLQTTRLGIDLVFRINDIRRSIKKLKAEIEVILHSTDVQMNEWLEAIVKKPQIYKTEKTRIDAKLIELFQHKQGIQKTWARIVAELEKIKKHRYPLNYDDLHSVYEDAGEARAGFDKAQALRSKAHEKMRIFQEGQEELRNLFSGKRSEARQFSAEWNEDAMTQIEKANPGTRAKILKILETPFRQLVLDRDYDDRGGRGILIYLDKPVDFVDSQTGLKQTIRTLKIKGAVFENETILPDFNLLRLDPRVTAEQAEEFGSKLSEPSFSSEGLFLLTPKRPAAEGAMRLDMAKQEYQISQKAFREGLPVPVALGIAQFKNKNSDGTPAAALILGVASARDLRMTDLIGFKTQAYLQMAADLKEPGERQMLAAFFEDDVVRLAEAQGQTLRLFNDRGFIHPQFHLGNGGVDINVEKGTVSVYLVDHEGSLERRRLTEAQFLGWLVLGLKQAVKRIHDLTDKRYYSGPKLDWTSAFIRGYFGRYADKPEIKKYLSPEKSALFIEDLHAILFDAENTPILEINSPIVRLLAEMYRVQGFARSEMRGAEAFQVPDWNDADFGKNPQMIERSAGALLSYIWNEPQENFTNFRIDYSVWDPNQDDNLWTIVADYDHDYLSGKKHFVEVLSFNRRGQLVYSGHHRMNDGVLSPYLDRYMEPRAHVSGEGWMRRTILLLLRSGTFKEIHSSVYGGFGGVPISGSAHKAVLSFQAQPDIQVEETDMDFGAVMYVLSLKNRSEMRPKALTETEKNILIESIQAGGMKRADGGKVWLFGEQESELPFAAGAGYFEFKPEIPRDWFLNKNVLVAPGYGNLPFLIRQLGAEHVTAIDKDELTILWQKARYWMSATSLRQMLLNVFDTTLRAKIYWHGLMVDALSLKPTEDDEQDGMDFFAADLAQPLMLDKKYDLIVMPYVFAVQNGLENTVAWNGVFANIEAVLNPEGRILIMPAKFDMSLFPDSPRKKVMEEFSDWLESLKNRGYSVEASEAYPHYSMIPMHALAASFVTIQRARSEMRSVLKKLGINSNKIYQKTDEVDFNQTSGALKLGPWPDSFYENEGESLMQEIRSVAAKLIQSWAEKWPKKMRFKNEDPMFSSEHQGVFILIEMITNAVAHGNKKQLSEPVYLAWKASGNHVEIFTIDRGQRLAESDFNLEKLSGKNLGEKLIRTKALGLRHFPERNDEGNETFGITQVTIALEPNRSEMRQIKIQIDDLPQISQRLSPENQESGARVVAVNGALFTIEYDENLISNLNQLFLSLGIQGPSSLFHVYVNHLKHVGPLETQNLAGIRSLRIKSTKADDKASAVGGGVVTQNTPPSVSAPADKDKPAAVTELSETIHFELDLTLAPDLAEQAKLLIGFQDWPIEKKQAWWQNGRMIDILKIEKVAGKLFSYRIEWNVKNTRQRDRFVKRDQSTQSEQGWNNLHSVAYQLGFNNAPAFIHIGRALGIDVGVASDQEYVVATPAGREGAFRSAYAAYQEAEKNWKGQPNQDSLDALVKRYEVLRTVLMMGVDEAGHEEGDAAVNQSKSWLARLKIQLVARASTLNLSHWRLEEEELRFINQTTNKSGKVEFPEAVWLLDWDRLILDEPKALEEDAAVSAEFAAAAQIKLAPPDTLLSKTNETSAVDFTLLPTNPSEEFETRTGKFHFFVETSIGPVSRDIPGISFSLIQDLDLDHQSPGEKNFLLGETRYIALFWRGFSENDRALLRDYFGFHGAQAIRDLDALAAKYEMNSADETGRRIAHLLELLTIGKMTALYRKEKALTEEEKQKLDRKAAQLEARQKPDADEAPMHFDSEDEAPDQDAPTRGEGEKKGRLQEADYSDILAIASIFGFDAKEQALIRAVRETEMPRTIERIAMALQVSPKAFIKRLALFRTRWGEALAAQRHAVQEGARSVIVGNVVKDLPRNVPDEVLRALPLKLRRIYEELMTGADYATVGLNTNTSIVTVFDAVSNKLPRELKGSKAGIQKLADALYADSAETEIEFLKLKPDDQKTLSLYYGIHDQRLDSFIEMFEASGLQANSTDPEMFFENKLRQAEIKLIRLIQSQRESVYQGKHPQSIVLGAETKKWSWPKANYKIIQEALPGLLWQLSKKDRFLAEVIRAPGALALGQAEIARRARFASDGKSFSDRIRRLKHSLSSLRLLAEGRVSLSFVEREKISLMVRGIPEADMGLEKMRERGLGILLDRLIGSETSKPFRTLSDFWMFFGRELSAKEDPLKLIQPILSAKDTDFSDIFAISNLSGFNEDERALIQGIRTTSLPVSIETVAKDLNISRAYFLKQLDQFRQKWGEMIAKQRQAVRDGAREEIQIGSVAINLPKDVPDEVLRAIPKRMRIIYERVSQGWALSKIDEETGDAKGSAWAIAKDSITKELEGLKTGWQKLSEAVYADKGKTKAAFALLGEKEQKALSLYYGINDQRPDSLEEIFRELQLEKKRTHERDTALDFVESAERKLAIAVHRTIAPAQESAADLKEALSAEPWKKKKSYVTYTEIVEADEETINKLDEDDQQIARVIRGTAQPFPQSSEMAQRIGVPAGQAFADRIRNLKNKIKRQQIVDQGRVPLDVVTQSKVNAILWQIPDEQMSPEDFEQRGLNLLVEKMIGQDKTKPFADFDLFLKFFERTRASADDVIRPEQKKINVPRGSSSRQKTVAFLIGLPRAYVKKLTPGEQKILTQLSLTPAATDQALADMLKMSRGSVATTLSRLKIKALEEGFEMIEADAEGQTSSVTGAQSLERSPPEAGKKPIDLSGLTQREKEVWLLWSEPRKDETRRTYPDIAGELNISEGTVATLIHRAKEKLSLPSDLNFSGQLGGTEPDYSDVDALTAADIAKLQPKEQEIVRTVQATQGKDRNQQEMADDLGMKLKTLYTYLASIRQQIRSEDFSKKKVKTTREQYADFFRNFSRDFVATLGAKEQAVRQALIDNPRFSNRQIAEKAQSTEASVSTILAVIKRKSIAAGYSPDEEKKTAEEAIVSDREITIVDRVKHWLEQIQTALSAGVVGVAADKAYQEAVEFLTKNSVSISEMTDEFFELVPRLRRVVAEYTTLKKSAAVESIPLPATQAISIGLGQPASSEEIRKNISDEFEAWKRNFEKRIDKRKQIILFPPRFVSKLSDREKQVYEHLLKHPDDSYEQVGAVISATSAVVGQSAVSIRKKFLHHDSEVYFQVSARDYSYENRDDLENLPQLVLGALPVQARKIALAASSKEGGQYVSVLKLSQQFKIAEASVKRYLDQIRQLVYTAADLEVDELYQKAESLHRSFDRDAWSRASEEVLRALLPSDKKVFDAAISKQNGAWPSYEVIAAATGNQSGHIAYILGRIDDVIQAGKTGFDLLAEAMQIDRALLSEEVLKRIPNIRHEKILRLLFGIGEQRAQDSIELMDVLEKQSLFEGRAAKKTDRKERMQQAANQADELKGQAFKALEKVLSADKQTSAADAEFDAEKDGAILRAFSDVEREVYIMLLAAQAKRQPLPASKVQSNLKTIAATKNRPDFILASPIAASKIVVRIKKKIKDREDGIALLLEEKELTGFERDEIERAYRSLDKADRRVLDLKYGIDSNRIGLAIDRLELLDKEKVVAIEPAHRDKPSDRSNKIESSARKRLKKEILKEQTIQKPEIRKASTVEREAMVQAFKKASREFLDGLRVLELRVVNTLIEHPEYSNQQIADAVGSTAGSVSVALSGVKAKAKTAGYFLETKATEEFVSQQQDEVAPEVIRADEDKQAEPASVSSIETLPAVAPQVESQQTELASNLSSMTEEERYYIDDLKQRGKSLMGMVERSDGHHLRPIFAAILGIIKITATIFEKHPVFEGREEAYKVFEQLKEIEIRISKLPQQPVPDLPVYRKQIISSLAAPARVVPAEQKSPNEKLIEGFQEGLQTILRALASFESRQVHDREGYERFKTEVSGFRERFENIKKALQEEPALANRYSQVQGQLRLFENALREPEAKLKAARSRFEAAGASKPVVSMPQLQRPRPSVPNVATADRKHGHGHYARVKRVEKSEQSAQAGDWHSLLLETGKTKDALEEDLLKVEELLFEEPQDVLAADKPRIVRLAEIQQAWLSILAALFLPSEKPRMELNKAVQEFERLFNQDAQITRDKHRMLMADPRYQAFDAAVSRLNDASKTRLVPAGKSVSGADLFTLSMAEVTANAFWNKHDRDIARSEMRKSADWNDEIGLWSSPQVIERLRQFVLDPLGGSLWRLKASAWRIPESDVESVRGEVLRQSRDWPRAAVFQNSDFSPLAFLHLQWLYLKNMEPRAADDPDRFVVYPLWEELENLSKQIRESRIYTYETIRTAARYSGIWGHGTASSLLREAKSDYERWRFRAVHDHDLEDEWAMLNIMIEGEISAGEGSPFAGMELGGNTPDSWGPFWILTRDFQYFYRFHPSGREDHWAYLVPNQTAIGFFEKGLEVAVTRGLMTEAERQDVRSKLITYDEFNALEERLWDVRDEKTSFIEAIAQTGVTRSVRSENRVSSNETVDEVRLAKNEERYAQIVRVALNRVKPGQTSELVEIESGLSTEEDMRLDSELKELAIYFAQNGDLEKAAVMFWLIKSDEAAASLAKETSRLKNLGEQREAMVRPTSHPSTSLRTGESRATNNSKQAVSGPKQSILMSDRELKSMSEENFQAFYKFFYQNQELELSVYSSDSKNPVEGARFGLLRAVPRGSRERALFYADISFATKKPGKYIEFSSVPNPQPGNKKIVKANIGSIEGMASGFLAAMGMEYIEDKGFVRVTSAIEISRFFEFLSWQVFAASA